MADAQTSTQTTRLRPAAGPASPTLGRTAHIRRVTQRRQAGSVGSQTNGKVGEIAVDDGHGGPQKFSPVLMAGRVLAKHEPGDDVIEDVERSLVELGAHMSSLVGADGYHALVARSVHRATVRFPVLDSIRPVFVEPGRITSRMDPGSARPIDASGLCGAALAVLEELLRLLEEFLGQDLTQRLTLQSWPWLAEIEHAPLTESPQRNVG